MTGFKPQTSGIGSDCSTNLSTQPLPNIKYELLPWCTLKKPNIFCKLIKKPLMLYLPSTATFVSYDLKV